MNIKLRDYQQECIDTILEKGPGKWLCSLCVGLGKTVIFTHLPRKGRTLILAHKRDLIDQPIKFFDCPVGIEMAEQTSNGEEIIIASMQSMVKRLDKFPKNYFSRIILDEAHRAASSSYRTIFDYFECEQLLGFTGTAYRSDGKDLSEFFDEVIYEKDLKFGIENGYLAPVECVRVDIGYDLSGIRKRMGDLTVSDLARETDIERANKAIAEIYHKYPKPAMIFAVNQKHAENIAKEIGEEAQIITSKTKKADDVLEAARRGEINCVITVIKLSEGTDIPCIRTGIMARPTLSLNNYVQSAGRIFRLHETKEKAYLIDCVGNVGRHDICTAPCLLGLTESDVPESEKVDLIGDLLEDLPELIATKSDCPESWIKNTQKIKLFEKKNKYKTYHVNYIMHPDGAMIVSLPKGRWLGITKIDPAGNTYLISGKGMKRKMDAQTAFDWIFRKLVEKESKNSGLWNLKSVSRWKNQDPSNAQIRYCYQLLSKNNRSFNLKNLKKGDIATIISRLKNEKAIKK